MLSKWICRLRVKCYLLNATAGATELCGRVTWRPDAPRERIKKQAAKCPGTKIPYGFSVQGIVLNTDQGLKRLTKNEFGHALDATSVHTILENYLGDRNTDTLCLAKSFLKKLNDMEKFFESQTMFHNFGSSFLFVYDHGKINSAQVHLIDFASALPGNGKRDEGLLFGLQNVRVLFENFISD